MKLPDITQVKSTRIAVKQIYEGIEFRSVEFYEPQTDFYLKKALAGNEIVIQEIERMPKDIADLYGAEFSFMELVLATNNSCIIKVLESRGTPLC